MVVFTVALTMRRKPLAAVLVLLSAALVLGGNALLDAGWGSALRAGLWTAERGASTIPTRVSGGQHGEDTGSG